MRALSAVDAVATSLAGQAGNTGEAAQTILAGGTAGPGGAGIALVAAVASGAHGASRARHTRLLLKLLHFRRQRVCRRVTWSRQQRATPKLTDFILKVANVADACVVIRLRVVGGGQHADGGYAVAEGRSEGRLDGG